MDYMHQAAVHGGSVRRHLLLAIEGKSCREPVGNLRDAVPAFHLSRYTQRRPVHRVFVGGLRYPVNDRAHPFYFFHRLRRDGPDPRDEYVRSGSTGGIGIGDCSSVAQGGIRRDIHVCPVSGIAVGAEAKRRQRRT